MSNLEVKNLQKSFGNTEVLHGVNVVANDGEFVALVGPSGCGKSTLLRLLAGLEDISEGEVWMGGRLMNEVPSKDRDIAMVFQNYALYPHMTVRENMGFSLEMAKANKDDILLRVEEAADILGLNALLARYPKQLSGGQRQRVAMGRAIVRDPAVFLFDEPLSNLDAKLRVQMRAEIKRLRRRLNTTTIYVTHDQIEAMTLADKMVVMNEGYVEQAGSPLEIYDRPASLFVAGFVGSPAMNLITCKVSTDFPLSLTTEGGTSLPVPPGYSLEPGQRVVWGARPEALTVDSNGELNVEIDVIEPTGAETHIIGRIEDNEVVVQVRARIEANPGEVLTFSVDPMGLHLFDAASGVRVEGGAI